MVFATELGTRELYHDHVVCKSNEETPQSPFPRLNAENLGVPLVCCS